MATPIPKNRASFRLGELESLGDLVGPDVRFVGVTTDSRSVAPGELFVALRGESFDGHRFVAKALADGAAAVLVSDSESVPPGSSAIVVADTLVALGAIANRHRIRWGRPVVGITGSAGKTTTKELVRTALEGTGLSVHATHGNLNNRIGVPMTLLSLDESHDLAVVEMGTSELGEIAALAGIAAPDVGLITSIGLSHAAGIGSVDDVAKEKGALFDALASSSVAVVNVDDPRIAAHPVRAKVIRFGSDDGIDVRLVASRVDADGASGTLVVEGVARPLRIAIPSLVALLDAAGAIAVAIAVGRPVDDALAALARGTTIEGRMNPIHLRAGALVVDDTYNANPRSMVAALESSSSLARSRGGMLVAVLGDMRELGEHAGSAHAAIGAAVVSVGVGRFVAVGVDMRAAAAVASESGVATEMVDDAELAVSAIGALSPNDVVVVKGSRSMRMERVVRALVTAEAVS